jgi:hypothetical protein
VESNGGDSILTGQPWQDVDIASFLESEDDVDRQRRYGDIRAKHEARKAADESDVDLFDEASARDADDSSDATDPESPTQQEILSERRGKRSGSSKRRFRKWSAFGAIDVDRLKVFATALLTVAIVLYLGWMISDFMSGPDVRILENID